jgi:NADPH:quinone reductase-like Zn-dependent oxidoreductase
VSRSTGARESGDACACPPYLIRLVGYRITRPKHPIPGADVAGRVVVVGDDVTRFGPGDDVFGIADGASAEYAAADGHKLVHKPANLTFQQAGVVAISGGTALQARADVARLEAGQRVLVVGASGGVGTYTVQLAKALGGVVTGVGSTANLLLLCWRHHHDFAHHPQASQAAPRRNGRDHQTRRHHHRKPAATVDDVRCGRPALPAA